MAWQAPKVDWTPGDGIKASDLNRIEESWIWQYEMNGMGSTSLPTFVTIDDTPANMNGNIYTMYDVLDATTVILPPSSKLKIMCASGRNVQVANTTHVSDRLIYISSTMSWSGSLQLVMTNGILNVNDTDFHLPTRWPTYGYAFYTNDTANNLVLPLYLVAELKVRYNISGTGYGDSSVQSTYRPATSITNPFIANVKLAVVPADA